MEILACLTLEPHHVDSSNERSAIHRCNDHQPAPSRDRYVLNPIRTDVPKRVHRQESSGHNVQFLSEMGESFGCDNCYILRECRYHVLPFAKQCMVLNRSQVHFLAFGIVMA